MAKKTELKTCKICKKTLASDVKPCIHCGTAEPFPKESNTLLIIVTTAIVITLILLS